MAINPNFHLPNSQNLTAARLTKGIKGAEAMGEVSQHLANEATDTLEASGRSTTAGMLKDLKQVVAAVETRGAESSGKVKMSTQAALMAAGALMGGANGVVVSNLADALHNVTSDRKALNSFADQILQVPAQKTGESQLAGDTFASLSTGVLTRSMPEAKGNTPVALFLGGAFLSAEQHNNTLFESVRQSAPPPAIHIDEGMHGGFLLNG